MAQRKRPFDHVVTRDAVAGTNDLSMPRVRANQLYCIQHVAYEDETTACTDVRLLKTGQGGDFLLEENNTVNNGVLYSINEEYYLHEGQALTVRFSGATAGDALRAYFTGYYVEGRDFIGV